MVKNSSGPVAFILCGPCKEHSEKEVSRKNSEGKGYRVRAVGTPIMVLFNKSSFRILPVYQILVNPMNDSSCQQSITLWKCEVTAMRSSVRKLTFKKVLRPLVLLAALRPKTLAPHSDSTFYFTASNIHCPQLARTLRNSRG